MEQKFFICTHCGNIIAMVEDSPTYLRDKTTLGKIKAKAALEEEIATEEAIDDSGVITF